MSTQLGDQHNLVANTAWWPTLFTGRYYFSGQHCQGRYKVVLAHEEGPGKGRHKVVLAHKEGPGKGRYKVVLAHEEGPGRAASAG